MFSNFCAFFRFSSSLLYPLGAKTSKRYSSLKSILNLFKHFPFFFLIGPCKSSLFGYLKFSIFIIHIFFLFSLTCNLEPKLQNATHPSNNLWSFLNFFWIFFSMVLTKVIFLIFEMHLCIPLGNQKPQISGKPATVQWNGVTFGPRGWVFSVYRVLLTVKWLRTLWGHWVHFRFSSSLYLKNGWS